jgi:hypothetical protein
MIQFFIQPAHTLSASSCGELLQPLLPLFLLIDGSAGCANSLRAVDRFDPNHHPLRVRR